MTRARDLADYIAQGVSATELDILDGLTATTAELNIMDGVTSTAAELNILDGVTSTAAELNILDGVTSTAAELNILDGVTATTAELNYTDGVTSAIQTQLDTKGVTAGSSSIVTTGALNSGSITSGFGNIDSGASTITTTGLISGGSLDIDNVLINGTTIGHTDDTDLITLANGLVTVAGEVSMTTLDIGGTNVTSTAAELNILDGVTSTAAELNILDGVTSTAAELNILDGVTATTAELNILDGVTSTAAELNILDGVTATTAELNILDGVTSTAAELNALDGITAVVGELNALDIGSTAVGTAVASKAVILDSNKDYTGIRNLTTTGLFKPVTYQETYVSKSAASTVTCDLATANHFAVTLDQNTTFAFSNPPSSGTSFSFTLIVTQHSTAVTLTWPNTVDWAGGSAPDAAGNNEVQAYAFITRDGGTTYYGFLGGTAIA
tara:strand:- start:13398 stop:14723 length:1326 start_codon:yes stop_codon:yes gene_type:complete